MAISEDVPDEEEDAAFELLESDMVKGRCLFANIHWNLREREHSAESRVNRGAAANENKLSLTAKMLVDDV